MSPDIMMARTEVDPRIGPHGVNGFGTFGSRVITRHELERQRVLARVTPRQVEFLKLIADPRELTYAQMADLMGVHPRSVDNYFQGLRDEFGIRSKTGMLLFAVKWGIVKV